MSNKIIAVGDVHGCYREMMALYKQLLDNGIDPEKDKFVWLGDFIDRGPDSRKVVEQLIKWHKKYPHWVFLYGNHEDIFRDWINGAPRYGPYNWFYNGGKTTYANYNGHFGKFHKDNLGRTTEWIPPRNGSFPKAHLDFLFKETVYLHEEEDYVFVHAGLVPGTKTIVENLNFLDTIIWAREGFIDSTYDWGKFVVFGHSAAYQPRWGTFGMPIMMKNKCGIDGAVCPPASKNLLAIELPEKKIHGIKANSLEYFTFDYNITK
jgi:serine/threonine protein phosphatase 1